MKEIERKIEDVGYDSDDVFANNPSTLMGAKIKVVRKYEQVDVNPPQPVVQPQKEEKCPACKKPKLIDALSNYDTIQSKLNPTISIDSDKFRSPHYRRGKNSNSSSSIGRSSLRHRNRSVNERSTNNQSATNNHINLNRSVREPRRIIRKRRKHKKLSNIVNNLSTPRVCIRQCCINKKKAEESLKSNRSRSSKHSSPQKFNFSPKAVIKNIKKNKFMKNKDIKKKNIQYQPAYKPNLREKNTTMNTNGSILKERTAASLQMSSEVDPGSYYGQKNASKQKLRFQVQENKFSKNGNASMPNGKSYHFILFYLVGNRKNINTRKTMFSKNTQNQPQMRRNLKSVKGQNRKASCLTNNTFGARKYKAKTNGHLLPEESFIENDHNQTYSVKQNKKLASDFSTSNVEYSNYHHTIRPHKSDLPKFVKAPARKGGFKSTNTRLPRVKK